jgi:peptidoglycan/xylan/chitin deacetylase (PgdA/CDA1 family)
MDIEQEILLLKEIIACLVGTGPTPQYDPGWRKNQATARRLKKAEAELDRLRAGPAPKHRDVDQIAKRVAREVSVASIKGMDVRFG